MKRVSSSLWRGAGLCLQVSYLAASMIARIGLLRVHIGPKRIISQWNLAVTTSARDKKILLIARPLSTHCGHPRSLRSERHDPTLLRSDDEQRQLELARSIRTATTAQIA